MSLTCRVSSFSPLEIKKRVRYFLCAAEEDFLRNSKLLQDFHHPAFRFEIMDIVFAQSLKTPDSLQQPFLMNRLQNDNRCCSP